MPDDFVIARNPEDESTLSYLLRIPLGDGIVLKAKEKWPRTSKVYCHRVEEWPEDVEVVERTPVRTCPGRGRVAYAISRSSSTRTSATRSPSAIGR